MSADALKLELTFAGYTDDGHGQVPGSWARNGSTWLRLSIGLVSHAA